MLEAPGRARVDCESGHRARPVEHPSSHDEDVEEVEAVDDREAGPCRACGAWRPRRHTSEAPPIPKGAIVAFEALLSRVRNLRLADDKNDLSHVPSILLRGLQELSLDFDAA